jgi:hypothetical protein
MLLSRTGHAEQGIPIMLEQLRRDPQAPENRNVYDQLGYANLLIGKDEEAIYWSRRALAAAPNIPRISRAYSYIRIATANARLGHLDEASDDSLPEELGRPTPTSVPGARTIYTAQLQLFLTEHRPIIIDTMMNWWGRSLPGAIGLKRAGGGSSYSDAAQDRLRRKMLALTNGDLTTPIVAAGFNSERIDGRNLAPQLVALDYTNLYWYRGGPEAWEVAGLPESTVDAQDW